jgi:hypothetical protein|nr:MAG TPA: hypothetical protein [Caudoviricetes sp.]
MERINGYQVFIKEEMNNDNAKTVISEMIQRNVDDLENWKPESGMAKLLECQNNALYKALTALSHTIE